MRILLYIIFLFLVPVSVYGADLSSDSLTGKWNFTHMILDDESIRPVNRLMEFLPEGAIINYDQSGVENSRASYVIKPGVIIYTDKRGEQLWEVILFEEDKLHVNHYGADMFFEKQQ